MAEQMEFLPRDRPKKLVDMILSKLPKRDLVLISEVSNACYISVTAVRNLMDIGAFQVQNLNPLGKPIYRIYRDSVVEWLQKGADPMGAKEETREKKEHTR